MKSSSSSFAHSIELLAPNDHRLSRYSSLSAPPDCSKGRRCPNKRELIAYWGWPEPTPHPFTGGGVPVFVASYQYVTGRSGRTTYNEKILCQTCGEKFAANHGLALPEAERPAA